MTQPGVSQHVKKLETELGQPLLNRHGKQFELTPAGERLYQFGQDQQQQEAKLRQDIAGDDPFRGECRLACSGAMAMQLYPELLKLQRQYKALSFSLEAAPNQGIVQRILENQSDLGIVTQPVTDKAIEQQKMGEDELCLITPAGASSHWQSLLALGFINHPDGHHYASQVLEANFPEQFQGMSQLPQQGYINQLSQILLPVAEGLGFTVLPRSALSAFPYPEQLDLVELKTPVLEPVFMIRKKHRPLSQRYQTLTELIISQWQ